MSRAIIHIIVLAFGWSLYFGFLWHALTPANVPQFKIIGLFLLGCVVTVPVITYCWIRYNLHFKNKTRRITVSPDVETYDIDSFGVPVFANWSELKKSSKIVINITYEGKFYTPVDNFN
jgi:hypothetical protein